MAGPIINKPGINTNAPTTTRGPAQTNTVKKFSNDGLGQAANLKGPMGNASAKLERGAMALPDHVDEPDAAEKAISGATRFQSLSSQDGGGKWQLDLTPETLAAEPFRGIGQSEAEMVEGSLESNLMAGGDFAQRHADERRLDSMKRQLEAAASAQSAERMESNSRTAGAMQNEVFSKYQLNTERAAGVVKLGQTENNEPNFMLHLTAFIGEMNGGGPEAINRANYKMLALVKDGQMANLNFNNFNKNNAGGGMQRAATQMQGGGAPSNLGPKVSE